MTCYVELNKCPTSILKKNIHMDNKHLLTRKDCIEYFHSNGIFHMECDNRDGEKTDMFKKYTTHTLNLPHTKSVLKKRSNSKDFSKCAIHKVKMDEYFNHYNRNIPNIKKYYLYDNAIENEGVFSNAYIDGHLNISNGIQVKGVDLTTSLDNVDDRIVQIQNIIQQNEGRISSLYHDLDVYKGTVNHKLAYTPPKTEKSIEVLHPLNIDFVMERYDQRTIIEDNIVNWVAVVRYLGNANFVPSIIRIKLPYSVDNKNNQVETNHYLPIQSFVRYKLNDDSTTIYELSPTRSYVDMKTSTEYLTIQHSKQTNAKYVEFNIYARYITNVTSFNMNYISPMRYDMINFKYLTPLDVIITDEVFTFYDGKMQWNMLENRIDLTVNLSLYLNGQVMPETGTVKIQLPWPMEVYSRYNQNPYGTGTSYIKNDEFINQPPIVNISDDDNEYLSAYVYNRTVNELEKSTKITYLFQIRYFKSYERPVRLQNYIFGYKIESYQNVLNVYDTTFSNSTDYETGQYMVTKTNDFILKLTKTELEYNRSFNNIQLYHFQSSYINEYIHQQMNVNNNNIHLFDTKMNYGTTHNGKTSINYIPRKYEYMMQVMLFNRYKYNEISIKKTSPKLKSVYHKSKRIMYIKPIRIVDCVNNFDDEFSSNNHYVHSITFRKHKHNYKLI